LFHKLQAYGKALEFAQFAPLLPMVECVKNSDLQGGESDTTILSTADLKEKILGYSNLYIVAVLRKFL